MSKTQIATLGGGCFWCLEAVFQRIKGVEQVQSGYSGGTVAHPDYKLVCSGTTGHVEVVQITFDPEVINYPTLLSIFFSIHDPTTLNRQGADVGSQYRSVIFYHNSQQHAQAQILIDELADHGLFADPIVTALEAAQPFYPAEPEHDDFYNQHASQPYCQMVIAPKLDKLKSRWKSYLIY